ncbi:Crp/Fnr family transcriptional regulator [Epilithonimonas arachidiradicis]|uniref:CRP-like cAMP-binding protein n=1 Tax=Epilithonimonas arachidiradicis TaxID=1617282 RepID=A0A420DCV5_9FLAO|nr:Crp/Fnr family transcriptional regulator [Epilithonimonas arachidiradicis]RKE89715.1 CRP-like cAMP-binding protein [Epilithonimonas arachidiradicis]GGG44706.1 cyclic nucleotide-binding protein [Epilithonimonas arachidiradicis]
MEQSSKEFLLKNIPGITVEDVEILSPYTKLRTFESGEIYIRPGDNNRKVYFIKSGIVRVYHLSDNGTEKTILFHNKKSFFGNYDGIIYNQPSRYFYQSIGETELFELTYDAIHLGSQQSITINNLRADMFLMMIGILLKNIEDFVLLNPEERYQKHLEENAAVLQKVPSKYIASLLGITPVSLSRIKKRILRGN